MPNYVNVDWNTYNRKRSGAGEKQMRVPELSGKEMLKVLCNELGYTARGGRGDHVTLENIDLAGAKVGDRFVTVPVSHQRLKEGTKHGIIKTVLEHRKRINPELSWNDIAEIFYR